MGKTILLLAAAASLLSLGAAYGEETRFAPVILDQKSFQEIMAYLGEVPAKYANPLIMDLNRRAQEAQQQAAKAPNKKPGE